MKGCSLVVHLVGHRNKDNSKWMTTFQNKIKQINRLPNPYLDYLIHIQIHKLMLNSRMHHKFFYKNYSQNSNDKKKYSCNDFSSKFFSKSSDYF